jgi:hypothetical protein
MPTTPNMNLTLPIVSQTTGPTWANQINADLSVIDSHNHTPGAGAQIPSAALNINADVGFGTHSAVGLTSTQYVNQLAPTAGCSVYALNGDLYYNDSSATPIQITSAGSVVGPPGQWTNLTPPAVAGYNVGTGTFYFQTNAFTFGTLQSSALTLQSTVSLQPVVVTVSPSTAAYTLTLPTVAPAQVGSLLSSSNTGGMSWVIADSSMSITSSIIGIANQGVTQAKMENKNYTSSSTISGSYGAGTYTLASITVNFVSGRPAIVSVQPTWQTANSMSSADTSGSNYIYSWYRIVAPSGSVSQGGGISVYGGAKLPFISTLYYPTETGVYTIQYKCQVGSSANIIFAYSQLAAFQL